MSKTTKVAKAQVLPKSSKAPVPRPKRLKNRQTAPKHSNGAEKAHPAPDREDYDSGGEYATACRSVDELWIEFDKTVSVKPKTSEEQRALLFIEAYIANGNNGTKAAIAAGFSPNGADVQACRMLVKPRIAAAIAARQAELAAKFRLTTEDVLNELRRMVHVDPRKFFNADGSLKKITDMDDDCAAALASVETDEIFVDGAAIGQTRKVKFWDKNSAIEKAMKHLGLFEKDNKQKYADMTDAQIDARLAALDAV